MACRNDKMANNLATQRARHHAAPVAGGRDVSAVARIQPKHLHAATTNQSIFGRVGTHTAVVVSCCAGSGRSAVSCFQPGGGCQRPLLLRGRPRR